MTTTIDVAPAAVVAQRSPLRVALVELFGVGGTADYTDCLAAALAARGHRVAVLTSSLFEPLQRTPGFAVTRVFEYRTAQSKLVKAAALGRSLRGAREALRRFRPDVVHAQGTVMPLLERRLYAGVHPAPRVCTVHDVRAHEWRPWLGSYARYYASFDALVCHSAVSAQRLQRLLPRSSPAVIPHGRYAPLVGAAPGRDEARTALGLPAGAHVVLLFGFLRRYKGIELFVEAVREARRDNPRLIGLVAGRPMYDIGALRRRTAREGLPVRWDLGYVPRPDMAAYFAAADVVALPYTDTSDSGMIELAAAHRRPVVATAVGGLREAFARCGAGALVPPNDVGALAVAMARTYPAPAAVEAPGNSWEDVAARTELLYHTMVEAAARPSPGGPAA